MSQVKVSGNASGTGVFTVAAPNSNSNYTLTLPTATTTVVGTDATQTLTNKTLTSPTITGAVMSSMGSSVITSGTPVATTSGTYFDFTGIPSWAKRIVVMLSGVSTNSTSPYLIQLGTSSGIETSGYTGAVSFGGGGATYWYSTGFNVFNTQYAATFHSGNAMICLLGSNTWTSSSVVAQNVTGVPFFGAGTKTLSGTLDRIRFTTVNGTDTFDAGTINIQYE